MGPQLICALLAIVVMSAAPLGAAQTAAPAAASQNPSPMVETTRAHERLVPRDLGGVVRSLTGAAGKPVEIWIPDDVRNHDVFDLVVHFHGAAWVAHQAVQSVGSPQSVRSPQLLRSSDYVRSPQSAISVSIVAAVVNLGAGSTGYHRAFADPPAFDSLLAGIEREVSAAAGKPERVANVTLSGFSAGHGAVRAIIRHPRHFAKVDAVLLLDGMHTSYVPEGTVLDKGGTLDTTNLTAFADFARAAMRGEKRFVVTHSEIFPGTFASTTETADWLLRALRLKRTPVLRWGPLGMQQLSEVHAGQFELVGFAGNSAPDHVDHLHAMPHFLARALGGDKRLHHYVFVGQEREKLRTAEFLETKQLEGAQVTYTWRQLEPEKNAYDFSGIREDLAFLTSKGKRLFIQLQDVSFSESRINVPAYLLSDPGYNGGAARQYETKNDDDNQAVAAGWTARRWDPAVQERFHKLLFALGREFDGRIEGINFAETSLGFGTSGKLFPQGFTHEIYRDAVITNMKALKRAFPKSVAMVYGNFMPGEWRPTNDKGYLRAIYKAAVESNVAMGGPDLMPYRAGQLGTSYPLIREVAGMVPTGIAVQDGNLAEVNPATGKRVTVAELVKFATEYLKADYVFWGTEEPYYSDSVIPFLRRIK